MSTWSSIYRLRSVDQGELSFVHKGHPVIIKAPAQVREEFVIGRNNMAIHYWFGRLAQRDWGIPFGSPAFTSSSAEPVGVLFSDMEKLLEQIELALVNPYLRSKFFHVPKFNDEDYQSDWFADDLTKAATVLHRLIREDETEPCIDGYAYEAG